MPTSDMDEFVQDDFKLLFAAQRGENANLFAWLRWGIAITARGEVGCRPEPPTFAQHLDAHACYLTWIHNLPRVNRHLP